VRAARVSVEREDKKGATTPRNSTGTAHRKGKVASRRNRHLGEDLSRHRVVRTTLQGTGVKHQYWDGRLVGGRNKENHQRGREMGPEK